LAKSVQKKLNGLESETPNKPTPSGITEREAFYVALFILAVQVIDLVGGLFGLQVLSPLDYLLRPLAILVNMYFLYLFRRRRREPLTREYYTRAPR
jgi:uncharacterized membrane protein